MTMFELNFRPSFELISIVRRFVSDFYKKMLNDADAVSRVALATHELLENAVKYSTPSSEVAISIWEESDRVVVAVTNTVAEESPHIASLKRRLDWAHGFPSPAEAYMAALSEVFDQNGGVPSGQGGLGLVRIAYEGGCSIDCDSATDGKVTVRAFRAIAGDAAPTSGTG